MKTLFILRHAKSSWAEPDMADFERPLNERGRATAPFMGKLMAQNGFEPYVILSSPAARAKETALLVKKAGKLDADIRYEHRIYEASAQQLREVVAEIDDAYPSALLVGHNPGIEGFIRRLTGKTENMPTAALAVVDLKIDSWFSAGDGRGELNCVFRPKEEMGATSTSEELTSA